MGGDRAVGAVAVHQVEWPTRGSPCLRTGKHMDRETPRPTAAKNAATPGVQRGSAESKGWTRARTPKAEHGW